jgi:hypothetical protein
VLDPVALLPNVHLELLDRPCLARGADQELSSVRRVGRSRAGAPQPAADQAGHWLKALAMRMGMISRPAASSARQQLKASRARCSMARTVPSEIP